MKISANTTGDETGRFEDTSIDINPEPDTPDQEEEPDYKNIKFHKESN